MTDAIYLWLLVGLAALVTVGWRVLGIFIGDRIPKDSIWSDWVNAMAYAMVSGVMMIVVVYPSGLAATAPLSWRLATLAAALLAMLWLRQIMTAVMLAGLVFVLIFWWML